MNLSRRQFLQASAAGAAAAPILGAAAAPELPHRPFGKTGMRVPILGFGSGSRFLTYQDEDRRQIDLSLKRLRTDRLDVLHIHALAGAEDLAKIEAPDGVLKALYEAREQKLARAIGITCHADPAALKSALERHDFDCTQMALNAAMARMAEGKSGMKATPMGRGGFEELALPVAVGKGMGVIAMKVFAQDQIVGA